MMTPDEAIRLAALRERLYRCVEDELNEEPHHKSYEGAIDVTLSFPPIFSRSDPPKWIITWHCYNVPENGRHHGWEGSTLSEALAVAEAAAETIAFPYETRRFERSLVDCCDEPGEDDGSVEIHGKSKREESARNA